MPLTPRDRLIVALDVPTIAEAEALVADLGETVSFYKIGMELAYTGGIALGERLMGAGKQVFFDLKLHDIGTTVERATRQIAGTGAAFMTVHAYPQTLAAAVQGAAGSGLGILGVSVLTSMDDADCARAGYGLGVADLVRRRARQTMEAGAAGLICAPSDVGVVRETVGAALAVITPGVRPAGAEAGDQKRVMTPGEALAAGADRLVIGRPVHASRNPRAAVEAILAEMGG
jgi:orotidine-5'-phosphate decarboxylase